MVRRLQIVWHLSEDTRVAKDGAESRDRDLTVTDTDGELLIPERLNSLGVALAGTSVSRGAVGHVDAGDALGPHVVDEVVHCLHTVQHVEVIVGDVRVTDVDTQHCAAVPDQIDDTLELLQAPVVGVTSATSVVVHHIFESQLHRGHGLQQTIDLSGDTTHCGLDVGVPFSLLVELVESAKADVSTKFGTGGQPPKNILNTIDLDAERVAVLHFHLDVIERFLRSGPAVSTRPASSTHGLADARLVVWFPCTVQCFKQ